MGRARRTAADRGSRKTALGAALLLAGALVPSLACGPNERTVALERTHSQISRERAAAARTLAKLGKPDDDELWVSIERLTRDPSVQARIAAAESLQGAPLADDREPDERGALADDALSAELSDLDETVRIAAAKVLGGRCNPRAIAYLHGAFARSGPAVREQVAASLGRCGVGLDKLLAHAEEVRRMHALEKVKSSIPAWRAEATLDLGELGRPDDVALIAPLVDDRDGAVAAAAAQGLGLAGATSAIPSLQKLAGDRVPLIAIAAIDALAGFGPVALEGAQAALLKQSTSDGEQAVTAAGALIELRDETAEKAVKGEVLCAAAAQAKIPAAAALLAHGCPLAPFGAALATLLKGVKGPLEPDVAARAGALLEGLAQAGQGTGSEAQALGEPGGAALGQIVLYGKGDLAARAAQVAGQLHASGAGPALMTVAQRERAALLAERAAKAPVVDDHAAAARELAEAAMRAPAGDRQKIAKLMAMVKARQEKSGAAPRPDAAARLKQLLTETPADVGEPSLLAIALRAALAVDAKGAKELAASLQDDPDPSIAAAARGTPLPPAPVIPAVAPDCFRAPDGLPSPTHADAGEPGDERPASMPTYLAHAPTRAAKPGCLAAQLSLGRNAALPAGAVEAARASLWSDDGSERALACVLLDNAKDSESAKLRADFIHDPERRVRDACSAPGTASPGPR